MRVGYLLWLYGGLLVRYACGRRFEEGDCDRIGEGGPIVVKVAQWIAQRDDTGFPFRDRLRTLQCKGREYPFEVMMREVKKKHRDMLEVDPKALGVGSIAQVYRGRYKGEELILKIRIPNIVWEMEADLTIVYWVLKLWGLEIDFGNVYRQVFLSGEGEYLKRLEEIFFGDSAVKLPKMIYCCDSYNIQSFCEGVHINEVSEAKYVGARVNLFLAFCRMIKYGVVHGDLHDGNVLCDDEGKLYLLDFGMMITLSETEIWLVREFIRGYYYLYTSGEIDQMVKAIGNFRKNRLEKLSELNIERISGIVRKIIVRDEERKITLIKQNGIRGLIDDVLAIDGLWVSPNVLHVLGTIPIIEGNVTNKYGVDFIRETLKI